MLSLKLGFKDSELSPANRKLRLSWMTVSYRSVMQVSFLTLCAIAIALYLVFPGATHKAFLAGGSVLSRLCNQAAPTARADTSGPNVSIGQQARFVSLDGTVRVKHKGESEWVSATSSTALSNGDLIQTSPEGMARVVFAGGTNYTVRPDSLIVIEENNITSNSETKVAVEVQTGSVDLFTGSFSQGSKSQVIVGGAVADLRPESSASVLNDNTHDTHEVLLRRGTASITRQGESVELTRSDKVSFQAESAVMVKKQDLLPPALLAPANQFSLVKSGDGIEFAWEAIDEAKGYHLEVSRDPSFRNLVVQSFVSKNSVKIGRLHEGAYYWSVRSVSGTGKESTESERAKFMLVPEALQPGKLALTLDELVEHGHIVEITGTSEIDARVVVNGEEVPVVDAEGKFHYFTSPLPQGQNVITVIAENSHGGMNRQVRTIFIQ